MTLLWVLNVNIPSRESDPLHSLFWVSIPRNQCRTCFQWFWGTLGPFEDPEEASGHLQKTYVQM